MSISIGFLIVSLLSPLEFLSEPDAIKAIQGLGHADVRSSHKVNTWLGSCLDFKAGSVSFHLLKYTAPPKS